MSEPRFPCPCCGYPTLLEPPPGTYELCPVCFWEDDGIPFEDPTYRGGANTISLNEARASFAAMGVSDLVFRDDVRGPTAEEERGRVVQPSPRPRGA